MDQKAWIAAIVGLIIGVLLGAYVCAGGNTSTPPKDTERGDPPPLPSQLVESMPEGGWPKIECSPGQKAIDVLDEIATMAWNDKNAELCTPPQWNQAYNKACQIAMNPALQSNAPAHCMKLDEAKTAAMNHEWQMALDHLEHVQ